MKPVDESSILKEQWFGQFCKHQNRQFEKGDNSMPVLIYCNHKDNPEDCEGNCKPKICPLVKTQSAHYQDCLVECELGEGW